MALLVPPLYSDLNRPLVFLAGPIQGAPDWHRPAIELLNTANVDLASPRYEGKKHKDEEYYDQVKWEHYHLQEAAKNGVTLFWMAKEVKHVCDRAYAQTSRFELGEAMAMHVWQGIKMVVGMEEGFSNARYLRYTISQKAPGIPLCETLEETCARALELLP
jgi:hypothetical protein